MNTITYRFFPNESFFSLSCHIILQSNIDIVLFNNFSKISSGYSQTTCEYYQKYYRKITFPKLQEAHMRYVTIIRNLREDADKTQQEIADFLGTSQTMYARYERGANEMPIRHLMKLAQYYNVSLDYLCGLSTLKRPYPLF